MALPIVRQRFASAAFIKDLGIELTGLGKGWCETRMVVQPRMFQADKFVHAGVQATLADHTAGTAAMTECREGESVLSIEFKLNLLRPALGSVLRCRADVVRSGRTIAVVESRVFAVSEEGEKMVSTMMATMAITRVGLAVAQSRAAAEQKGESGGPTSKL
jgi:uncharacterized protein (TIGR00369 family)